MRTIQTGVKYVVQDSNGVETPVSFPFKDEAGSFHHGIEAEELLAVLIARYEFFIYDKRKGSTSNMSVLLNLKKAMEMMQQRNHSKQQKRTQSNAPVSEGNGISV